MSCFSRQVFFWWGGGGGHGILPTVVGYAMRGGAQKKTHQIIGGGLPKM